MGIYTTLGYIVSLNPLEFGTRVSLLHRRPYVSCVSSNSTCFAKRFQSRSNNVNVTLRLPYLSQNETVPGKSYKQLQTFMTSLNQLAINNKTRKKLSKKTNDQNLVTMKVDKCNSIKLVANI